MAALALAEEAILEDNPKMALSQLDQALPKLAVGSPARQRAQDIKARAIDMRREERESR
jgi:predicted Zn-dependent protease